MNKILSSWKEIATFLGKGVRTVQRWEDTLGLPVHRPAGPKRNIVFAKTAELDAWLRQKSSVLAKAREGSASHDTFTLLLRSAGEKHNNNSSLRILHFVLDKPNTRRELERFLEEKQALHPQTPLAMLLEGPEHSLIQELTATTTWRVYGESATFLETIEELGFLSDKELETATEAPEESYNSHAA